MPSEKKTLEKGYIIPSTMVRILKVNLNVDKADSVDKGSIFMDNKYSIFLSNNLVV